MAGNRQWEAVLFTLFVVDPLVKVLPDTPPTEARVIVLHCARNEVEPAQFALQAKADLSGVTVEVSPLRHEERDYILPPVAWNFVGFIPVPKNTGRTPPEELIRQAPCEIPDPLLPARQLDVPAGRTQPVWLTVTVPADAPPGEYRGEVTVRVGNAAQSLPLQLTVYDFTLPAERHLWVTNWFSANRLAFTQPAERGSVAYWQQLALFARNLAAHRQNVFLTPWTLIKVWREADGKLTFDYTDFDRYVQTFLEAGLERIEISHLAHHGPGGWGSREVILSNVSATDRQSGERVTLGPKEGLGPLLADLERHLTARGWLEQAMIHICDEPALHNLASWQRASDFVHQHAPRLKRIDAIETTDFFGQLEVWVPKLNHLRNWLPDYQRAKAEGAEVWFYTCLHPTGRYMNRFLDYSLLKVRLLHWLNVLYDLDGYLHWGLNHWRDDPYGPPSDRLPPGDTHIIYPGEAEPVNSLRWEMMREGLEDYEYFWLLREKQRRVAARLGAEDWVRPESSPVGQRAKELCRRAVRHFTDYLRDPAEFWAVRQALAEEIVALEQPPLVLFTTNPPAQTVLDPEPIVIQFFGVTEPGARVKLNGRPLEVDERGRFAVQRWISPANPGVTLVVEKNGRRKELRRQWKVR
ncbi:MAG TPA: DUF4091 domain-containing protein [Armatimonadetes bacterium]|nr:DUF4091 domain-containing protein [Armatimonadota bacterium]